MNNNPDQIFYITYSDDDNGRLTGQISQDKYNSLKDEDRKKYTQAFVDRQHLYGWGRWWDTVCYRDGALQYPGNWEKDQSLHIDELKKQLSDIIASNDNKEKSNKVLEAKLNEANNKIEAANKHIDYLGQLSISLQAQLANVQGHKTTNDNSKTTPISSDAASSMAASAAAQSNNGGNQ